MTFLARVVWLATSVALAIGLGAYSADWATQTFAGFAPLSSGQWKAYPGIATADADPYARAQLSRGGKLAIADTEGIEFSATRDDGGRALSTACDYRVHGDVPANRLWTFRVNGVSENGDDAALTSEASHSRNHVRAGAEVMSLHVGPTPSGINWHQLSSPENKPVRFVMTLYDSPAATTSGFAELEMPAIELLGCADG